MTQADYDRAKGLQRGNTLIRNGFVSPHWIGSTDEFWYRHDLPQGHDYAIVNAATGRKRPAFDHEVMARALAQSSRTTLQPTDLPITNLMFADGGGSIRISIPAPPSAGVALTRNGRFFTGVDQQYDCRLGSVALCTPVTMTEELEGVIVSPDGRKGVFTKDGNLWLREMQTGQERQLTKDGEGPNYGYGIYPGGWKAASIPRERQVAEGHRLPPLETSWSPDSRTILVPRVDQRHVADYPYVETVPGDGSFRPKLHMVRIALTGEKPATAEWVAIDAATGKATTLAFPYDKLLVLQQDMLATRKTWWGPDNTHLYAVSFGDNMESAWFFDADITTGRVRTVIEERAKDYGSLRADLNSTSYNPPNVQVAAGGKQVIWWSQRDGWGHLYLYDGETGRLRNQITKGNWLVRDVVSVDDAKHQIFFTGAGREGGDAYFRYLYRVNFDGTGLTLLSPEKADHAISSPYNDVLSIDGAEGYSVVSPSGKYVVYNYSTVTEPTQTAVRTVNGKLVAIVEKADASALFAAGYRVPEPFVTKSADGTEDIYGVLYRPTVFDSTRRYAVVDAQYASPLTAVVPHSFPQGVTTQGAAAFAALGFVSVIIDGKGTTYRSRAFTQSIFGHLNVNGLDDHVAAIKALARRYAFIDTTRVGLTGGSYGGWSTWRGVLEFPDFYKVGVATVPPGALQGFMNDYHFTAEHGRPVYSDGSDLRPTPSEVATNWNVLDSRQQAERLKGHLLVILNELDENVPTGSVFQVMDALMKADKDVDLIYLPNTPHSAGAFAPYVTRRRWDYFVRYLMGATPP
ncbi:MAG: DPP IV N-terminal domain-containing protein [Gemmatimonadaceae bacterium]|nr:DPP IV N-terminal domain-containing protein [Gemmatimonadaceae bacterium]